MATGKKTTKKKTAKKKTTKKPGLAKPSWSVNAGATRAMTKRSSVFFPLPQGRTTLRVLPRFDGASSLFARSVLHYKTQSLDNAERNIAPACLREHGDGNCYLCNLVEFLKASDEPVLAAIGEDLYPTTNLHLQAFVYDRDTKSWYGPRLVRVPKSVGDKMADLLTVAADNDMPVFCDPENGQGITVIKSGEGLRTRYDVQPTSKFENLDDIVPGWEKQIIKDMWEKLDVKVLDIDKQKRAAFQTWPDLPWAEIEAEIG